jgi:hypothetical protein
MSLTETGRHRLPLLAVSQAQKEITHNEALARLDALVHPVFQDELNDPPLPTANDIGKCWLVASAPTAAWAGKARHIAYWIGGGWRHAAPTEGMRARLLPSRAEIIFSNGSWQKPVIVSNPAAGTVVDVEARAALATLLSYLRLTGQIA